MKHTQHHPSSPLATGYNLRPLPATAAAAGKLFRPKPKILSFTRSTRSTTPLATTHRQHLLNHHHSPHDTITTPYTITTSISTPPVTIPTNHPLHHATHQSQPPPKGALVLFYQLGCVLVLIYSTKGASGSTSQAQGVRFFAAKGAVGLVVVAPAGCVGFLYQQREYLVYEPAVGAFGFVGIRMRLVFFCIEID
uniref:Uncharacterized protein n=1 Tax=Tanacetum cinerariifolium TaxID=118510 RepID=A0A699KD59_TANCI|nr:hypothetical protein [Tanacetum cinerariifolium]